MKSRILLLLLIASSCCIAEDFTVKVDEGMFSLSGVSLKTGRFPRITGKVTNNTDREWKSVDFQLVPYDASGNVISVKVEDSESGEVGGLFVASFGSLKPGESKRLELSFRFAKALKSIDVAKFDIRFKTGVYPAKYTFAMSKPNQSDDLRFQDEFLDALFIISKQQIACTLKNKTDNPIRINSDQVAYVDFLGTSRRILHKGVKLLDKEHPQPPTIIPPKAQIDDLVLPTDYVAFVFGNWKQADILADNIVARQLKGKTVSVFMPLEINGSIKNYSFEFLASNVQ